MIFSSKPALIAMEKMMTQPPFYRPPGHGKYQPKKLPPDKAHYKCEYCLHYDRKEKCKLIQCPYMDERIKAGAVSLPEALVETMKDIHNTAFRKRFNKMLMKSEERKMISFRSEVHRKAFLNAIENIDPDNKVVISVLSPIISSAPCTSAATIGSCAIPSRMGRLLRRVRHSPGKRCRPRCRKSGICPLRRSIPFVPWRMGSLTMYRSCSALRRTISTWGAFIMCPATMSKRTGSWSCGGTRGNSASGDRETVSFMRAEAPFT